MDTNHCHIIVNPAAGGSGTGRMLDALTGLLRASFGDNFTVFTTSRLRDAISSTREALLEGTRRLVIVGGDGTMHECISGILSLPLPKRYEKKKNQWCLHRRRGKDPQEENDRPVMPARERCLPPPKR